MHSGCRRDKLIVSVGHQEQSARFGWSLQPSLATERSDMIRGSVLTAQAFSRFAEVPLEIPTLPA